MKLNPMFSYFGSKYTLAKHYPEPVHDTIVEPFAGSAGYSLNYADRNVVLIDADPVICGIWRLLIEYTPDEILALPDFEPGSHIDDYDIDIRAKWLIGFWINRCTTTPCKVMSKRAMEASPLGTWTLLLKKRLAEQSQHIKHWKVLCTHYGHVENIKATWFVDPPYQTYGYRYVHNNVSYDHLSYWCRQLNGQVIVCENDGATWLPFRYLRDINSSVNGRRSNEVYWTNDMREYNGFCSGIGGSLIPT